MEGTKDIRERPHIPLSLSGLSWGRCCFEAQLLCHHVLITKLRFLMSSTSQSKKSKMSELGAKKHLLIEKGPAKKMRDLELPQIHLAPWTELGVLLPQTQRGLPASRTRELESAAKKVKVYFRSWHQVQKHR